jgi:hypothetical protein
MKIRTTVIVAALILSLALLMPGNARCDELSDSYYPLTEGMRWEYNVISDRGGTNKLIITNLASRKVNGITVTPRKMEMGGNTFFELMERDDNGIYRYAEQKAENTPPSLITPKEWHLKFPITQGSSWHMTIKLGNDTVNISLTIESVSDKVTVPAGAFMDCVKIKQVSENGAGATVMGYEWYAPKVGVVKSMVTIKQKTKEGTMATENRTYQLLSFKP